MHSRQFAMGTPPKVDLLQGRGQMPLRHAIRWTLGQNLCSREALLNSLLWGLGMGALNTLTNPGYPLATFVPSLLISFCIGYLSMIPWRWRIVPRGTRTRTMVLANGTLAFAFGYACFYASLWGGVLIAEGAKALGYKHLYGTFAAISLGGFIFAIIGYYITVGYDVERGQRRNARTHKRLERLAEEARMAALRAQINPHFFFNALNTIAALIPERPADAERAVELMATALRPVLVREQPLAASLESELRVARAYAEIEGLRLGDRLRVRFDIEPGLESAAIPSLSLQPLVENAVRHGAAKTAQPTEIVVSARREGGGMAIAVDNRPFGTNGHDIATWAEAVSQHGHAVHNLGARLRSMCGPQATLSVRVAPDGLAARTELRIPEAKP